MVVFLVFHTCFVGEILGFFSDEGQAISPAGVPSSVVRRARRTVPAVKDYGWDRLMNGWLVIMVYEKTQENSG